MSTQPEALRLAQLLEKHLGGNTAVKAAAELRRLHQVEIAFREWIDKTAWVQHSAAPGDLGKHRADVLRGRIDHLHAEIEQLREQNTALDVACANLEAQHLELLEALNRVICNPNAPNLAFARAAIAKCQ